MAAPEQVLCPHCGAAASSDDFVCPKCEVILNASALEAEPISLVQALLAPPNAPSRPSHPRLPAASPEGATTVGVVVMDEHTVPRLTAGIEIGLTSLEPFEALVASHVDGILNVPELAIAAKLARVEIAAVLQTLAFKDVITLERYEPIDELGDDGPTEPGGVRAPAGLKARPIEAAAPTEQVAARPSGKKKRPIPKMIGDGSELGEEPKTPIDSGSATDADLFREVKTEPEYVRAQSLVRISAPSTEELTENLRPKAPVKPRSSAPLDEEYLFEPSGALDASGKVVPAVAGRPSAGELDGAGKLVRARLLGEPSPATIRETGSPVLGDGPEPTTRADRPSSKPELRVPAGFGDFDVPVPVSPARATPSQRPGVQISPTLVPIPAEPGTSGPRLIARAEKELPREATGTDAPLELAREIRPRAGPPSPAGRRVVADISGPAVLPPSPAESALQRAVALERTGDVDGAIRVLKNAIAGARQPAPLYNKLALAMVKRKQFKEAATLLDKALTLEPKNATYQQNLRYVAKILID